MSENYINIGKTIVKEDFEETQNSEFAAWFTRWKVPAGEHNLYAAKNPNEPGFNLVIEIENSVIVAQNSQSHFGGVGYGTDPGAEKVGKEDPITLSGLSSEFSRDGNLQHVIE
jgi:hypothetical protein